MGKLVTLIYRFALLTLVFYAVRGIPMGPHEQLGATSAYALGLIAAVFGFVFEG